MARPVAAPALANDTPLAFLLRESFGPAAALIPARADAQFRPMTGQSGAAPSPRGAQSAAVFATGPNPTERELWRSRQRTELRRAIRASACAGPLGEGEGRQG